MEGTRLEHASPSHHRSTTRLERQHGDGSATTHGERRAEDSKQQRGRGGRGRLAYVRARLRDRGGELHGHLADGER